MEKIADLTQVGWNSLVTLGETIMSALPAILGALFLLLIGWLIAKFAGFITRRALRAIGFDKLITRLELDKKFGNITLTGSKIIGRFVYWVILLLFFITASDTLGWTVVSQSIGDLITYLPQLLSGLIIFVIGFYIADFVRKGLRGILESLNIKAFRILSNIAYYIILIIITVAAIDQIGIDTQIITSNITVIIGGIVLAFAVSFGFSSRHILLNILSSFYTESSFKPGQKIEMGDITGTIEKIDTMSCTIKTNKGLTVIPVSKLLSEEVSILD